MRGLATPRPSRALGPVATRKHCLEDNGKAEDRSQGNDNGQGDDNGQGEDKGEDRNNCNNGGEDKGEDRDNCERKTTANYLHHLTGHYSGPRSSRTLNAL